jgi:hypothetical protein
VPKHLFRPPSHLIKEWPEVFEDMYMNTMPVAYLKNVRLEFNNGRIWEIDIQEQLGNATNDIVAEKLLDTFTEYKEEITKVDFTIDIQRLKQDITDKTKKLF